MLICIHCGKSFSTTAALRAHERDAGRRPSPMCRDCADNDGTCPNDGRNLPCDPAERRAMVCK